MAHRTWVLVFAGLMAVVAISGSQGQAEHHITAQ